ncbi:MAG: hypothetical protein JRF25_12585 [Deltaproteobacteria bacterium]|nr:hypothetical protein [Deltaproteobacteria bacterium]
MVIKKAMLEKRIKKDTPYTPAISEICIMLNQGYCEYPRSSHGNPEKRNERTYSRATHKKGPMKRRVRGFEHKIGAATEKTAI